MVSIAVDLYCVGLAWLNQISKSFFSCMDPDSIGDQRHFVTDLEGNCAEANFFLVQIRDAVPAHAHCCLSAGSHSETSEHQSQRQDLQSTQLKLTSLQKKSLTRRADFSVKSCYRIPALVVSTSPGPGVCSASQQMAPISSAGHLHWSLGGDEELTWLLTVCPCGSCSDLQVPVVFASFTSCASSIFLPASHTQYRCNRIMSMV